MRWDRAGFVRSGEDVGPAIGEIRRCRGLTQEQLAAQAGLSRTWLAKPEPSTTAVLRSKVVSATVGN